jgi:hypothetical protein
LLLQSDSAFRRRVVRCPRWANLLNSGWGREADHRLSASGLLHELSDGVRKVN